MGTQILESRLETVSTTGDIGIENLIMNIELQDRVEPLDFRWNVLGLGWYPYRIPARCLDEARILHWNGQQKPWTCHDERGLHDDLFQLYAPRHQSPVDRHGSCTSGIPPDLGRTVQE